MRNNPITAAICISGIVYIIGHIVYAILTH